MRKAATSVQNYIADIWVKPTTVKKKPAVIW